jgi:hypothetical protein
MTTDPKDIMRHHRIDTPSYLFWVFHQPFTKAGSFKGKAYRAEVKKAGQTHIATPIASSDIEIEISYSTQIRRSIRADVDNLIKPTLDALKGVAYLDDHQVRSVTTSIFDLNQPNIVDGLVQYMGQLFHSCKSDVLLVVIYSDTRLSELGGEAMVKEKRFKEWEREINERFQSLPLKSSA